MKENASSKGQKENVENIKTIKTISKQAKEVKPVIPKIAGTGTAQILTKAESALEKNDDLGAQTVGGAIEAAKIAGAAYQASTMATEAGLNTLQLGKTAAPYVVRGTKTAAIHIGEAAVATAREAVNVGRQISAVSVTVAQAYKISKEMEIKTLSKAGIKTFQLSAADTGLANTVISQRIQRSREYIKKTAESVRSGVTRIGNGMYQVYAQSGNAAVAISQAYNLAKGTGVMPVSREGLRLLHQSFTVYGVNNSRIAKGLIHSVSAAKSRYDFAANTVKGVRSGTLSVSFVMYRMEMYAKSHLARAITKGAGAARPYISEAVNVALNGTIKTAKVITPKVWKVSNVGIHTLHNGALTLATSLGATDDYAVQGVANAIQTLDMAGKAGAAGIKTGARVTTGATKIGIRTVKTGAKVGRTFWESYARTNSIRKAMESVGRKGIRYLGQAVKQAGGSIMSAMLSLIKGAARKIVIPIILIAAVAGGGLSVIGAPVVAVSTFFSGIFSMSADDGSSVADWTVEDFLLDNIPVMTAETKNEILNSMTVNAKAGGGSYDIIRLKAGDSENYVSTDMAGINEVFMSDEEIINLLEPLFNSVMLMYYELSPNESQATEAMNTLYNGIFSWETEPSIEYCGQALADGSGEATMCSELSGYHAVTSGENACPNYTVGTHSSYTDSHCDTTYYTCLGYKKDLTCGKEEHTHEACTKVHGVWSCGKVKHIHVPWTSASNPGCYSTAYHSTSVTINGTNYMTYDCGNASAILLCGGYAQCNGHSVLTYKFNLDGIYGMLQEIFYDPIEALEAIPESERTEEEKEQLSTLYDNLEIYNIMVSDVYYGMYGGGMSMEDLSGIQFNAGTRTGNQDVVDLALSQVGQVGGQPYWSYYGFSERVNWCACFVHWCMCNTPSASSAWYITSNNAYCQTIADYYSDMGQFGNDASLIAAGDLIFFDWTVDGHTDHIGIIIGTDGTKIYTVEGNSGDQVKVKSYDIDSSVIYGFGYMNY
jgi:hypothetical protein